MSVLKNAVGITFWICGVPGSASIVKVNAPRAIVPGMRRFGMSASLNIFFAKGYTAKTTTNRLTPLYVKMAPINTIASVARFAPTSLTIVFAMEAAKPDISTTFPKMAPSRNTGKYSLINPAIFSINMVEKKEAQSLDLSAVQQIRRKSEQTK